MDSNFTLKVNMLKTPIRKSLLFFALILLFGANKAYCNNPKVEVESFIFDFTRITENENKLSYNPFDSLPENLKFSSRLKSTIYVKKRNGTKKSILYPLYKAYIC